MSSNVWLVSAFALLTGLLPCAIVTFRGTSASRLAGLEAATLLIVLIMLLLAEGYHRSFLYDLALMLALLSFGGGLVFARFLERWF